MADTPPFPGMPRWAKVQSVMVAALFLAVLAMATGLVRHGGGAMGGHAAARGAH